MRDTTNNHNSITSGTISKDAYEKVKGYDLTKQTKTGSDGKTSYLVSTKRELGRAIAIFDTKKEQDRKRIKEFNKRLGT